MNENKNKDKRPARMPVKLRVHRWAAAGMDGPVIYRLCLNCGQVESLNSAEARVWHIDAEGARQEEPCAWEHTRCRRCRVRIGEIMRGAEELCGPCDLAAEGKRQGVPDEAGGPGGKIIQARIERG